MTNRREFLQTAAVLSAAPLAGRVAFANGREPAALEAVVFDSRHMEARAFGARADVLGAPLHVIEGDITNLWQNHLRLRLKTGALTLGGLTERPALFLLERLAWDHGLRVVFEGEHEPHDGGRTVHRIIRSADAGLGYDLETAGRGWPSVLADALIAGRHARTRDFRPTDAGLAAHLGEPTKLYSWIIAPRSAA